MTMPLSNCNDATTVNICLLQLIRAKFWQINDMADYSDLLRGVSYYLSRNLHIPFLPFCFLFVFRNVSISYVVVTFLFL